MPFANGDLINGELMQFFQLGTSIPLAQIAFLDIFDDLPADLQMPSHVFIWSCGETMPTQTGRIGSCSSVALKQRES